MATTTNYGWTTPDNTDLVKDGAAAIRTLGSSIDTTLKAQIDAQIPDSLLTTTGDVIYASGASTPARLGIGTNGQVLSSNGTIPAWTTPTTAFDSILTPEQSTFYVKTNIPGSTATSLIPTTSSTYYTPIFLPTMSVDRIALRSHTSGYSATGNTRLGLYNCSSTTGKPTTVVFDAGTVSVAANSTTYEITISQNITAGWYYLAINSQSGTYNFSAYSQNATYFNSTAATLQGGNVTGYVETGITGAFATAGTITLTGDRVPLVGLRVA